MTISKLVNILAIFAFSLAVAFYAALLQTGPNDTLTVHVDAPLWIALKAFAAQWFTLRCFRLLGKNKAPGLDRRHYIKVLLLSGLSFSLLMSSISLPIEYAAGLQRIDGYFIALSLAGNLVLHLLVGGITLLLAVLEDLNQQALALENAKKLALEQQVALLQAQLDPHFLFNNLNVLSALINKDPHQAEEFLHTFCDIYRYVLENRERRLVTLQQELTFAENYIALLDIRFNGAYKLVMPTFADDTATQQLARLLPPCTLQLTLENVVKHNQADSKAPLEINIDVDNTYLRISNTLREKTFKPFSSGLGLANLSARSQSLCGKDIKIQQTNHQFSVAVPLLDQEITHHKDKQKEPV
ncbi:sensor histidine kinase [Rheinheimera sp.]|uniref:sensor histidine kinase n=1 Tax=Rheinheimera sp. TaxID=1869214 RepID=UPI0040474413